MIERAIEGIKDGVRIETGAEFAAGDASTDDLARNLTPGPEPLFGEGFAQSFINLGASDRAIRIVL